MKKGVRRKKPLGHTIWFKVVLTIIMFLPLITQSPYQPADTTDITAQVLSHPLITQMKVLLPIAKALLLAAVMIPFITKAQSQKVLLSYYGIILLIVGLFQNMANTNEYGYVWLTGNALVQFIVAIYCFYDLVKSKTIIKKAYLHKKRLWVIIPMALAFFMPYSINANNIIAPSFTPSIFYNEAGVTYCMITPVVIGIMIMFSKGIYKPLLSVISYVGFLFGLLNMITWFVMQSQNLWMGVLHLPLLILSLYGLVTAYRESSLKADNQNNVLAKDVSVK